MHAASRMNDMLLLDRAARRILRGDGRAFDPLARAWLAGAPAVASEAIEPIAAVRWLAREGGVRWRVPVAVVGPREIDARRYALAERIGAGLGTMGLPVVCGGRGGVMEAACKGAQSAGGLSIGLLPEADPELANPHVGVVVATGIGEARNALIARAALCLIAIGDSFGTLSEVALGRQFGKRVIGLAGAANVEGVEHVADAEAALATVAQVLLALD